MRIATPKTMTAATKIFLRRLILVQLWRTGDSGGQPPQSQRFAPFGDARQSRSVWTAVALAPLSHRLTSTIHAGWSHLLSRLQKEIPLLLADGHSQFFHHLQHVFPDLALFAHRLVAEQIRRMIRRHERRAAIGLPTTAQLRNADGF